MRQDKAISKVLMGQTLTVEMEGKNSQAAAQTHADVADDLADADKSMVTDAWNEIAWVYDQVNAGPGVLAPLAAYEEPEDLNVQADLDKNLSDIGVEFTEEHFTEKYGLNPGEFRVRSAVSTEKPPSLEFSAPKEAGDIAEKARKRLDAAITDMLPAALKASLTLVAEEENAVDKAGSFDELEASLVDLLAPSMRPDALEAFLASAMTAAAGHGASAVQKEAEDDA